MDYKERIEAKAHDLAYEQHGEDFYDLSEDLQEKVYQEAMEWEWDSYYENEKLKDKFR